MTAAEKRLRVLEAVRELWGDAGAEALERVAQPVKPLPYEVHKPWTTSGDEHRPIIMFGERGVAR